ncbi:hypothetical protein Mgra_00007611 [Meloidogyne graminicola]|uniref:Uncharacterized protein n=1 Tax=Meloidogyne graminicola TaxID=189291 RepID=A0A8S9ZID8_9BILA|nr:hypothetical protein Mgra_00007611 [Meloidogyne graminicola]
MPKWEIQLSAKEKHSFSTGNNTSVNNMNKKVYRSFIIIIKYFINPVKITNMLIYNLYSIIPVVLLNFSIVCNAPILYINSIDYNNAYKKEFKIIKQFLFKLFGIKQITNTVVVTIPRNQINTTQL